MNIKQLGEFTVATVLVVLLILLANPFGALMLSTMQMLVLAAVAIAFALFTVFVWRERAVDEREAAHLMFADRMAYITGAAVIMVAIIIQTFAHELDQWLITSLIVMVVAKAFALYYSRQRW